MHKVKKWMDVEVTVPQIQNKTKHTHKLKPI